MSRDPAHNHHADSHRNESGRRLLAPLWAHAQRLAFAVLFLAVATAAAVLTNRYHFAFDWTAAKRNTLSAASTQLLQNMPQSIRVRAFVSDNEQLREATRQMLRRYQRAHNNVILEFVNPQREPREAQRLGVRDEGELVIEYEDRRENVKGLSEAQLSNALSRLARKNTRWIGVLTGRGERDFLGETRNDLGQFARHLQSVGVRIQPITIGGGQAIADNVSVLVILQPSIAWNDEDFRPVQDWITAGGNVLWLADAHGAPLDALAKVLGVTPEAGMLIDPSSRLNGQSSPEFIVVNGYASHPLTENLPSYSAFPTATSLAWEAPKGWRFTGLAASSMRSWRESGDLTQAVRFDAATDTRGPLDIALAGSRAHPSGDGEQRLAVFGDVDFLSNAYLGLGANRAFGTHVVNWLNVDDKLLAVPVVMAEDLNYDPDQLARAAIALAAPIILPLGILVFGLLRWRARRLK